MIWWTEELASMVEAQAVRGQGAVALPGRPATAVPVAPSNASPLQPGGESCGEPPQDGHCRCPCHHLRAS